MDIGDDMKDTTCPKCGGHVRVHHAWHVGECVDCGEMYPFEGYKLVRSVDGTALDVVVIDT